MKKSRSSSNLIFKNGFRNIFDSKFQLIGLVILFFLLGLIITSVSIVTRRVGQSLNLFYRVSSLHDAVASFSQVQITSKEKKSQVVKNRQWLNSGVGYQHSDLMLLQKIMQRLSGKYQFAFTRKESRLFVIDHLWLKVIGYSQHQAVDKLIITKGSQLATNPSLNRGVIFESKFAKLHNLKIGEVIRLIPDSCGTSLHVQQKYLKDWHHQKPFEEWMDNSTYKSFAWYQIRGFGISPDFTYPIISRTQQIVDKKLQGIAYVKNSNFGLTYHDHLWAYDESRDLLTTYNNSWNEVFYGLYFQHRFRSVLRYTHAINAMNTKLKTSGFDFEGRTYFFHPLAVDKLFFIRGDPSYPFARRTTFGFVIVHLYKIICLMILTFIGLITSAVTFLLIKQRVNQQKVQFGMLKASGYTKTDIFVCFLIFPISVGLVGGVIGFLLALIVGNSFVGYFTNFLNFPLVTVFIPWVSLIITVLSFFTVILLITWIATIKLFKKSCTDLIHRPNAINVGSGFANTWFNRMFRRLSFWPRFKLRVASTSLGKTGGSVLVFGLGAALLGTATFFGRALLDANKYYFAGQNYKVASFYQPPVWNVPTSFYRTYDFTNQPKPAQKPTELPPTNEIIDQLITRRISRDYYSLKSKLMAKFSVIPSYLFQIGWKNFNLSNFKVLIRTGTNIGSLWSSLIVPNEWPDYQALKAQLIKNKLFCLKVNWLNLSADWVHKTWQTWLSPPSPDFENLAKSIRRFYLKYRDAVLLSVNKSLLNNPQVDPFARPCPSPLDVKDFKVKNGPFVLGPDGQIDQDFGLDCHNRLLNDQAVVNTLRWENLQSGERQKWVRNMINWFNVTFLNRYLPALVQGIYSQAPYYVQQYFRQSSDYNLTFNIVPTTPDDYLGTYLNARLGNRTFRILGLNHDATQRFVHLGSDRYLQNIGFWREPSPSGQGTNSSIIPIVINQNLAHINHLKLGEVVSNLSVQTPQVKGMIKDVRWPTEDEGDQLHHNFDFSHLLDGGFPTGSVKGFLIDSLQLYQTRLKSITPYNPALFPAPITPMVTALHNHDITLQLTTRSPQFKIVGIQNNYGPPVAYVNQSQANHLLHYDWTQPLLYQLFRQIWSWHNYPQSPGITLLEKRAIDEINNVDSLDKLKEESKSKSQPAGFALRMFNVAFPLFNFRLSHVVRSDLVNGVAITDSFGDFSPYALNGGHDANNDYVGYGVNVLDTAFVKSVAQQIIRKQLAILLLVLIFISAVFISMSIVIISLTSDLIINHNRNLIQNLRIIGYGDKKILRIICDCFLWFLPGALALALLCGWFILKWWAQTWMLKFNILLPLIWHPLTIILCVVAISGLFLLVFGCSFLSLKRTSLIRATHHRTNV